MATVKFTNVQKIYEKGQTPAVADFNLDIQDKEFIVFVGPSGCGKSTTLRMLAGLEDISSGTIEIDGEVVNDLQPRDRNIAMVFQNYALYPHLTVFENMAFPLRLKKPFITRACAFSQTPIKVLRKMSTLSASAASAAGKTDKSVRRLSFSSDSAYEPLASRERISSTVVLSACCGASR